MIDPKRIFFCWTVSHHSAPIEYREKISPAPDQLDQIYTLLNNEDWINELTILSTCNRLEIYGVSYESNYQILAAIVAKVLKVEPVELFEKSKTLEGKQALTHLFSVTAGLDSQIVGETEITGQVKQSFLYAAKQRCVGTQLNKAFQKSFQSTKWIRSNTNIGKGQINVATVAVDLAIKVFGKLHNSTALVIGAGDIAEKTIAALRSRGVKNLTISNRTFEKARDLANTHGGKPVPFESLDCHLLEADVVLCSTASPDFILTESRIKSFLKKRAIRPLCLLDLALPRDIDPNISHLPNIFLYNLDDLAEIADLNLSARKREHGICMEHIERKVAHLIDNQRSSGDNSTTESKSVQQT
ncbi:MAG: glutamyl-tRNA reductase [Verrucomicrobia bacterium]|nr:glutamyl-tRNA reductase [Verrucomicrobiota bacterium]MDA1066579.1 glutamyl-tRNA reductase [Verrucomicrobiota bacterium]